MTPQEEWGATAAQAAARHHCHTVSQQLCLIQVVGGEDQCAIWAWDPTHSCHQAAEAVVSALCSELLLIPQNPTPQHLFVRNIFWPLKQNPGEPQATPNSYHHGI